MESKFKRLWRFVQHLVAKLLTVAPKGREPPGLSVKHLAEVDMANCSYGDELVEIQGVVSVNTSGGGRHSSGGYGVHIFCFTAWRQVGQPLVRRKLTVLRPVSWDNLAGFVTQGFSILRFTMLLSEDKTRAIVASTAALAGEDSELEEMSRELQKPVVISTGRLGDLSLDRNLSWFEGNASWNGEMVKLTICVEDDLEVGKGVDVLEGLFSAQAEWARRVQEYAVEELLPLKNEDWLDNDEHTVTAEQFKARMTLLSISSDPEGQFTFIHEGDDLLGENTIWISGSLEEGPTSFDISG